MTPRLSSSPLPPSPCTDTLEGHGDARRWVKVCWWSKTFSLGSLFILTSFVVSIALLEFHTEVVAPWRASGLLKSSSPPERARLTGPNPCEKAKRRYKSMGIDTLPSGIIEETTDLHFRTMAADPVKEAKEVPSSQSLLTMPVGIMQKETVNKIVAKFPEANFALMLFHYDGKVDQWNEFPWSSRAIHVAAANQTKWWFAKRFLHPDIVSSYKYIFLWDEDIGVEHFDSGRYIEIVEKEGLEISQPALDPRGSEVHHQITARMPKRLVHRRMYKFRGTGRCFENSTGPPCTGWVEMMVPVFSRVAWRCAWYMIQNDFVHSWGLDMKLGYCAQGERSQKVGVVDDQYVVHHGIPSLGGVPNKTLDGKTKGASIDKKKGGSKASPNVELQDRGAVRRRSYVELDMFNKRWNRAAKKDQCWVDPFAKVREIGRVLNE